MLILWAAPVLSVIGWGNFWLANALVATNALSWSPLLSDEAKSFVQQSCGALKCLNAFLCSGQHVFQKLGRIATNSIVGI